MLAAPGTPPERRYIEPRPTVAGLHCSFAIAVVIVLAGGGVIALGSIWLSSGAAKLSRSPPEPSADFHPMAANCTVDHIEHCWSQVSAADRRDDVCTDSYRVRFTAPGLGGVLDADEITERRVANAACQAPGCANSTDNSTHGGAPANPTHFHVTYKAGASFECWEPNKPLAQLHYAYECANLRCIKLFSPSEYANAFLSTATTGVIVGTLVAFIGLSCVCCGICGMKRLVGRCGQLRTAPNPSPSHDEQYAIAMTACVDGARKNEGAVVLGQRVD